MSKEMTKHERNMDRIARMRLLDDGFMKKEGISKIKMCKIWEEVLEEGKIETAKRMIAKGKMSLEDIAEYSDLPIKKIQELAKECQQVLAN